MQDIKRILPETERSILALDLETRGNDPSDPDFALVGIGLADVNGCSYLPFEALDQDSVDYLHEQLHARPTTAFNVLFDGGALLARGWGWLPWAMCSYGLFRQLATEGYDGQRWNLETLCRDVLGWAKEHNHKADLAALLSKHGLAKSEMWKLADLEPEPFGVYCAVDAEAHYQAFYALADATYALDEVGATLRRYHKEEFLTEVRLLATQQLRGLMIDVPALTAYRGTGTTDVQAGLGAFFAQEQVAPVVAEYNATVVAEHAGREPEPVRKDGQPSALWARWQAKRAALQAANHFNPGSSQQLSWLLFERLGYVPAKYTDSGAPSTDKSVLPGMGEPGKLLAKVKKKQKELTYVDAVLNKHRDGILHAAMKSAGAVTGRLSGGEDEE